MHVNLEVIRANERYKRRACMAENQVMKTASQDDGQKGQIRSLSDDQPRERNVGLSW